MTNQNIAKILNEIGVYLAMEDEPFKPKAYEKAAETIEGLSEEIAQIYKKGGLKAVNEIPGVGVSIAEKIEELLKTGRLKYYEQLKKKAPIDLEGLMSVEGLGPKTIRILYRKLKVRNLEDLERATRAGRVRKLEGFGLKSEENILKGIEFLKRSGGRFILGFIMPQIEDMVSRLQKLKEVEKAVAVGSVRRWKETIGDVDILVIASNAKPVMDFFVSMPEMARIFAHGKTKSAIKLKNGLDVDLRVVPEESYGAALNYFTGSKDHNIALRELAISKGWKLNEYGLFQVADQRPAKRGGFARREIMIAGKTEEELYKKLGLDYIEPELREATGEVETSRAHKLPQLINFDALQGDLQIQTDWTDGASSIEEMAKAALSLGLKYIAITDHTKRLAMTRGLDEKRIQKQWLEIDKLNKKFAGKIRILKGSECDILKNGTLDLPDKILAKCDVVGVSVHSLFHLSKKDQTERIKRAMSNFNADILFHPTGRIINRRDAYQVDMEELISHAKKTGTVLEINASPDRLDLKDEHIRRCVDSGVGMAINSDAHAASHFQWLKYGIAQARRGWAEKKDVINTRNVQEMLSSLKNGK